MKTEQKIYVGTYKVYKVFRVSGRREILARGLSRDEAMRLVNSYPSKSGSMVVFDKQFSSGEYWKDSTAR